MSNFKSFLDSLTLQCSAAGIKLGPAQVSAASTAAGLNSNFAINVDAETKTAWVNPLMLIAPCISYARDLQAQLTAQSAANAAALKAATDVIVALTARVATLESEVGISLTSAQSQLGGLANQAAEFSQFMDMFKEVSTDPVAAAPAVTPAPVDSTPVAAAPAVAPVATPAAVAPAPVVAAPVVATDSTPVVAAAPTDSTPVAAAPVAATGSA